MFEVDGVETLSGLDIGSESFRLVPALFSCRHAIYVIDGASRRAMPIQMILICTKLTGAATRRLMNTLIDEDVQ